MEDNVVSERMARRQEIATAGWRTNKSSKQRDWFSLKYAGPCSDDYISTFPSAGSSQGECQSSLAYKMSKDDAVGEQGSYLDFR